MARIQRAYRVVATYRNGDVSEWHYWTPEDAENRADTLRKGRPPALNDAEATRHRVAGTKPEPDAPVAVTVERSHEILWPHVSGDAATVDLPGTTVALVWWQHFLARLGIGDAHRVLSLTWHRGERIVLELENGKHNPTHWDVEIESEA